MGWRMVDEIIRKTRRNTQTAAQDVVVSGNSPNEVVVLTQGRNVVSLDPVQITSLYNRLIQIGAVQPVAEATS